MRKKTGSVSVCKNDQGKPIVDETGRTKFELYYYTRGGKRRHRKMYFVSRRAALDYIAKERQERQTTTSWLSVLHEWKQETTTSDFYCEQMTKSVHRLTARLGNISIQDVTAENMRDYLKWRRSSMSAAAARKDQAHFLSLARWARGQIIIDSIPWEHVGKIQHTKKQRDPIPVADIPTLLAKLDAWTRPIAEWIALTGMRQQDAARIEESHIHADRVEITIKGGTVVDYLLDGDLSAIIAHARDLKQTNNLNAPWLFVNSAGGRWVTQHLAHRIRDQWPSGQTLHCLRHTFGTLAGQMFGADMVQAGLAHKSRATSEIYSHVSEDAAARQTVGSAVRAALGLKRHTNSTQGEKTDKPNYDKIRNGKILTVEICGRKLLIPKGEADKLIDRYGV